MKKYFKYLKQVAIHRYYVALECWKYGLWWAPFVHDNSKLSPSEFKAYVINFMGTEEEKRKNKMNFEYAWNHHQKNNPHHGLYWVVGAKNKDGYWCDNGVKFDAVVEVLKMPTRYAIEMYCDWVAAGKAYTGSNDVKPWYRKNKDSMVIHPTTKRFVEELINANSDHDRKLLCKIALKYGY